MRLGLRLAGAAVIAAGLVSAIQAEAPSPQATPAPAQQPSSVFRSGVSLVSFDVTVLDAERRPVRGLTAADFLVTENGIVQTVEAVTEISVPPPDVSGAEWAREVGVDVATNTVDSKRLVVIVMNDAGIGPDSAPSAVRIAHAVIDQLGPSDLATVVHTYLGRTENFTSDRERLRAAVADFKPQYFAGAPPACSLKASRSCTIEVLNRVGDILGQAPAGRKILILVSPSATFSREFDVDTLSALSPVQTMFRKLQAANVTIYEIDPSGLRVTPEGRDLTTAPSLAIARGASPDEIGMAEQTGGRAIRGTNAPEALVPVVFEESSSYYLLGYESTNTEADGFFRNVTVEVTRPGLTVVARRGYYGPAARSDEARASALAPEDEAIARGLPSGDLPISVSVAPFAGPPRRGAEVVAVLRLREPALSDDAVDESSRRVNVVMAAFDSSWRSRGVFRQGLDLTLVPGATRDSEYEVGTRLPLAPGRYELRFAVERNGVAGSVFVSVDVPDFGREPLSLSGILVERQPAGLTAAESVQDVVPVVPTVERAFGSAERATTFLRVYQSGSQIARALPMFRPVAITAVVQDRLGAEVVHTEQSVPSSAFASSRAVDYRFELPLSQLVPGEYLLTVTASMADRRAQRTLRFVVRP